MIFNFIKKKIYKIIIFHFYDRVKIKKKPIFSKTKIKPKYFLICNLSSLGGMFSNLKIVLNGICEAEKNKLKPEVDMQNYPTLYNDNDIKFTKNSWLYYFKPLSGGLDKALKSSFVINQHNKIKQELIQNKKRNFFLRKIYKKKIIIDKKLLNIADKFYKKNFQKKKTIALHFRGTDAKITPSHNFPPTLTQVEEFLENYLKKNKVDKIFLITDELEYLKYFKLKYKHMICFWKSFRSNKSKIFNLNLRKKHNYKIGRDNIVDMIILSKIDTIIYSQSNLVEFAIFHSDIDVIKTYKLQNGVNSKNILISLFLWKIKNILPSAIGGFKNKAKIKKIFIN